MIDNIHPAAALFLGALLVAVLRGRLRDIAFVGVPVLGLAHVLMLEAGQTVTLSFLGQELAVARIDKLSLLFGYVFHVAAIITSIYSLHVKEGTVRVAGLLYCGSAVGAVFAGDFLTLFVFWEMLAVTSVFQIWARRSEKAVKAGMRYLLMHVTSGLLLLAGAAFYYHHTGSLMFDAMKLDGPASWLIFLAFGLKAGFPGLHTWLTDSYPEATPAGTLYLCCFTTKTAIYALARGFPGTEILIYIGVVMAMFPIFYAVIENDLRRTLSFSMINQLGFMVVGIGLGTEWGINGAVLHAFNDVFFKGLLFMSMGAVLYRTGTMNASQLGGLYKTMPWTAGFSIVGAASISGFPLLCAFVSKSMIMASAAQEGHMVVWMLLLLAAAGVLKHAGIKIPFFAFFAHDSGIRTREAPMNMLVAMGLAAVGCVVVGCFPSFFYSLLPETAPAAFHPYTLTHVVTQVQLLSFAALAFTVLFITGIYPPELRSTNLDADWFYRKGAGGFYRLCDGIFNPLNRVTKAVVVDGLLTRLGRFCQRGPARLLVMVHWPLWKLEGLEDEALRSKAAQLYERTRLGAFPIGLTGFFAVVLLAILFFF